MDAPMNVNYTLPTQVPTDELAVRNHEQMTRAIYHHLGLLGELAIAQIVRDFLHAHPDVIQIQLELSDPDADGCRWDIRFQDADEDGDLNEPATPELDLDRHTTLYADFETLGQALQANLDPDLWATFQDRYGTTGMTENNVWLPLADAETQLADLTAQLAGLTAPTPIMATKPARRPRLRR